MVARKKPVQFEKKLEELEDLVEALESGGLSLEESLKAFEQGIKITRECQEALTEAEQKVNLLTQSETGDQITSDFQEVDNDL